YRLNVVRLRMPALRERIEDLPILTAEILKPLAKEMGRPVPAVSPRAMKKLTSYAWPGNVRELRNVLERAMLTLDGREIRVEALGLDGNAGVSLPKTSAGLPAEEWEIR